MMYEAIGTTSKRMKSNANIATYQGYDFCCLRLLNFFQHTQRHIEYTTQTSRMRPSNNIAKATVALVGTTLASPMTMPTNSAVISSAALSAFNKVPSSMRENVALSVLHEIAPEAAMNFTTNAAGDYPTSALVDMATSALQTITTGEVHAHIVPEASTTLVEYSLALPSTTFATETLPLKLLDVFHFNDGQDVYLSGTAVFSGAFRTPAAHSPMDVKGGGWWEGVMASSTTSSTVTLVSTTASVGVEASWSMRPTLKKKPTPSLPQGWQRGTIRHSSTKAETQDEQKPTPSLPEGRQRGTISHSSTKMETQGDEQRGTIRHYPKTTSSSTTRR